MKCSKCGMDNQEGTNFCVRCGRKLIGEGTNETTATTGSEPSQAVNPPTQQENTFAYAHMANNAVPPKPANNASPQYSYHTPAEEIKAKDSSYSFFVDSSETTVDTLGNGYMQNIVITGKAKRAFAALTQKRLYFFGKSYNDIKGMTTQEERVIDLQDITGTGFVYIRPIKYLIIAFLCLLCTIASMVIISWLGGLPGPLSLMIEGFFGVLALVNFFLYFTKRLTLFQIRFAGGMIGFDVQWYPLVDAQNFHRIIRLTKDRLLQDTPLPVHVVKTKDAE